MKTLVLGAMIVAGSLMASPSFAAGCIKGAVVGGVLGHMAGHGAVGAAAGCAIGHHKANNTDPARVDPRNAPRMDGGRR